MFRQLRGLKLEEESGHIIFIPHMEKVCSSVRKVYGRSPTGELNDVDVNSTVWRYIHECYGKTSKLHTEECRNRIGEQMEHDTEGHERLQAHKRRRDVEPEIGTNRTQVARENEGDPTP